MNHHQQHQHHHYKVITLIHSQVNVQYVQYQIANYVMDQQYVQHVIQVIIGWHLNINNNQQMVHKDLVNHVCKDVNNV